MGRASALPGLEASEMAVPMRVVEPFAWGQRLFAPGEIVSSDDPVMRKHRSLFEEVVAPGVPVEQATQAPGERRFVRKPKET